MQPLKEFEFGIMRWAAYKVSYCTKPVSTMQCTEKIAHIYHFLYTLNAKPYSEV